MRIDPDESEALYSLARTLNKLHDADAQNYQNRFDELERRKEVTDRVELLRNFALEAGKAQNWPRGIEQLQQALDLCGKCSSAALLHKNLAFFYEQIGKIREAEQELEKVLAITPDDAKAKEALSDLHNLLSTQPQL